MGRQLLIFHIWIVCTVLNPGTVNTLLEEGNYDDLTCMSEKSDVGVDPNAISGSLTGLDNNLAFSYVCENFKYMFKCCGKIKEWKLWAGKTGTIQLQVWRRTDTAVYEMIGENYCQITNANQLTTCPINDYDKILVRYGDFVGWHNQGNETIMYMERGRTDSTLENLFRRKNVGDLYPGDTYDWSEVEAYNDRLYALQAIYETSTNPTFDVSDMTVPDYINNGDTIGRITYQDTDHMDNRSLIVVPYETSTYYTTDIPSGYVSANTAYRPRDDVLKFAMYDLCYKTATASVTVSVKLIDLVIDNLDATFTISETSSTQTLLHTVTVTDPSDQWYCYSNWDTSYPFMLKALTTESYGFYVVEHPGLDYDSPLNYNTLPVVCVENKVTSTATYTANIQVGLTKSRPPVITNLYASVTVNAETAFIGDSVFVVTATDPENEVITFTMSCTSDGSVDTTTFRMLKNGDVVLKRFVTLSTLHQFDCAVTVTDASEDSTTNYLHISILDADHAIVINNLPVHPIQLKENTAVGTFLYKFEYADTDRGTYDTKYWSCLSGVLSLTYAEIDAEDPLVGVNKNYALNITVGDVKSAVFGVVIIQIINENEAPWFTHDYFTIDTIENEVATQQVQAKANIWLFHCKEK
ncbi:uncharacterized protein LOC132741318 [Ruditapes philippinarum]|uniref:uncharacterized protein LOC132741318 n=1 Tax=Ruditapes philippinarum TaxID=129788 RepID=UPI00295A8DEE|nr:uncharacterized protein LOC132741318 [Ruditapes philippinarum]